MGISDDIRPKTYRPISKKAVKTEIKVARKKIEDRDDGQLFQETHDGDFFANTPIKNGSDHDENHKPQNQGLAKKYHWIYTLIIFLTVFILIGLVVWQNYSTIKNYFNGTYKKKNSQNLTDIINTTNDSVKNYNSGGQTTDTNTAPATQPASTPAIDKSTIAISVLNGSGTKNSASSTAAILKKAGFNVKSTGNAKSFNYTKTYIYYKTDDATAANLVKDALSSRTTEVSKNTSIVGAAYDIVVVVGKN
ncbi:MAG: LytR C-terminal domain-containing protein [Candidatus Berkelbacteria bacterium]|nr:LytR C-terminal domain-containing protein [Candidatus Berkelbacteria bacterium]